MEQRYIVEERWEKSYPDPIILQKDDKIIIDLSVKDPYSDWENWVWCESDNGLTGWVPTQILEVINNITEDRKEAIVLEDYSANELTVDKDEVLIGTKTLNGWLWCRQENQNIEGWVPLDNLKILD